MHISDKIHLSEICINNFFGQKYYTVRGLLRQNKRCSNDVAPTAQHHVEHRRYHIYISPTRVIGTIRTFAGISVALSREIVISSLSITKFFHTRLLFVVLKNVSASGGSEFKPEKRESGEISNSLCHGQAVKRLSSIESVHCCTATQEVGSSYLLSRSSSY